MRIVLLGPPGVGKGTQGRCLAQESGSPLISTGEMLRDAAARGTPFGLEARRQVDAGLLVADDVMIGLVRERTGEPDAAKGFVLDGFPRTVPQAVALDALLAERGQTVNAVVSLQAPAEELVVRLAARRECPVCMKAYNLVSAPPKQDEMCDDHPNTKLVRRADDAEDTIRRRLDVYAVQTAPLIEHYRARSRLVDVPGTGDRNVVFARLRQALAGMPAPR